MILLISDNLFSDRQILDLINTDVLYVEVRKKRADRPSPPIGLLQSVLSGVVEKPISLIQIGSASPRLLLSRTKDSR
jgi:hypothetical protein